MLKKFALRAATGLSRIARGLIDTFDNICAYGCDINASVQRRRIDAVLSVITAKPGDVVFVNLNLEGLSATQRREYIQSTKQLVRSQREFHRTEVIVIPLMAGSEIGILGAPDGATAINKKVRGKNA